MHIPPEPQPDQPLSARWGTEVVRCLRAFRLVSSAALEVTTMPDGTTARPRQAAAVAGSETHCPWRVSIKETDDSEVTLTVAAGMRVAVGGDHSENPETDVTLTDTEYEEGRYLVKQFSNPNNAWIEGIQILTAEELADAFEEYYIRTKPVIAVAETEHEHETESEIFPNTLIRQIRPIAWVSSEGIEQYAVGAIYIVGNVDEEIGEDIPEEDAEDAETCDQNDHPDDPAGDGDDGSGHPGDVTPPGGGGVVPPGDPDDGSGHPSDEDCFTTVPES